MSHQSRRRDGRSIAARTAPISVIIALLATIALVLGLGSTAAIGEELDPPQQPSEVIDDQAHTPGMIHSDPSGGVTSEQPAFGNTAQDDLVNSLDELNSVVQPAPIKVADSYELQVDGNNPPMVAPEGTITNRMMPMAVSDLTPSIPNPSLPQRCGANVAVVLDLSNSVKDANGVQPSKNATNAIIDAVARSGGAVGVFTFATRSPSQGTTNQPWLPLDTAQRIQAAKNHVNSLNTPSSSNLGGTSWESALKRVNEANRAYDIVYFITDGVPTANDGYNGGNDQTNHLSDPGYRTHFSDLDRAIQASNSLKAKGIYVAPVAVALQSGSEDIYRNTGTLRDHTQTATQMLQRIGQPYVSANNYGELEALIDQILVTCESNVVVEKQIVDADGRVVSTGASAHLANGWEFTLSGLPQGFRFGGTTSTTTAVTTAGNGRTPTVGVVASSPTSSGSVKIVETVKDGFRLSQQNGQNAVCRIRTGLNPDATTGWSTVPVTGAGTNGFQVKVEPGKTTYCVVQNRENDTDAAVEKNPRPGPAVQANAAGEAELVYTVKVSNARGGTTGVARAETGTVWESVKLPQGVVARGNITVGFSATNGVVPTGLVNSIQSGQFINGAQIPLASNLRLPAGGEATFTITVPVKVSATKDQWRDLGRCEAGAGGTFAGGVQNEVLIEREDFDGLENNIACIPIIQQQVAIEKGPRPGPAVEADMFGNADLVYTVTVSNQGGSTGDLTADSGTIAELVQLPSSVMSRADVTVSFSGTNGATAEGLVTTIAQNAFVAGSTIAIAQNVKLPANSTGVFTITVPVVVQPANETEWQALGECVGRSDGQFVGGVPNGVAMADDFDGADNNTACIPIIQQQVSVQKNPRPGDPVQANAQGEADLTFTIVVNNNGGSTGELEATSAKIIESVMLTEEVVANGDITVSFDGDTGVVANGLVASIPQASFVPGAQIVIADSVFLPAGTRGTFTLTVPVKVLADTAEEWNALGECRPGVDLGFSGGIHNAVIMDGDFDGVRNNIACIPILPMPKAAVTIIKEDHNGTELPGAKFALYAASLDGSGVPTGPGDVLVAELGTLPESATRFSADELNPGFYYLVEVQSPAGYSLLPQPIGFQLVYAEQAFSLQLVDAANHEHVVQIDDDLIMRVADTTAGDLPKSGSYGVAPYALLAGMILTLGFVTTRRLGVK